MDIIDACKLIIAKSPAACEEAIRTIAAARNKSPIVQVRYSALLIRAMADPQADFTAAERADLASAIEPGEIADTRGMVIHIRLTDQERADLQGAAESAGLSLSEYARRKLFSKSSSLTPGHPGVFYLTRLYTWLAALIRSRSRLP